MGGVLVAEMSSSFRRISSRSLGYSSNRSAKPVTQDSRNNKLCKKRKENEVLTVSPYIKPIITKYLLSFPYSIKQILTV